jgi:dihydroflavonol-4-reductase
MPSKLETVCVTGATGHVGANLIPLLLERGCDVKALLYDDFNPLAHFDVEWCTGDVLNKESLLRTFDGCDTVFHLAGVITLNYWRDERARHVNVNGTRNVLEACKECCVKKLVHFSSIHALSTYPRDETIDEARALCDHRALPYDQSKAEADRHVLNATENGLDINLITPTGIIGPNDYIVSPMGKTLQDLANGKNVIMPDAGFNWVDVRDVCEAAYAAAETGQPGHRYIVNGDYVHMADWAKLLEPALGRPIPVRTIPVPILHTVAPLLAPARPFVSMLKDFKAAAFHTLVRHQNVNDEKVRKELNLTPRPMQETINDIVAWLEKAGRLHA